MEKWFIKNKKADFERIREKFGVSEVLARILVNKGFTDDDKIKKYLTPNITDLYNPYLMKDMEQAADILRDKIRSGEKIRIIGDYDVDGIMSVYLLYTALRRCKGVIDYEVPDRIKDGYGINIDMIDAALRDGIDTILTCDNGIAASEQIAYAKDRGMTVVVTDHHDVPYREEEGERIEIIPVADAVVDPKQSGCLYPFKQLCGAGVALKLISVLYEKEGIEKQELESLVQFTAIATVCDVMDLTDENRILVKKGLELLKNTDNAGLDALMEVNQLKRDKLSPYHLGFIIGPCFNASGRLCTAKKSLELLLSRSKKEASKIAVELKKLNDIRKDMTNAGVVQAVKMVEEMKEGPDKVLVLFMRDCHESLAGIIAGRIREKYNRPVIILTGAEDGVKGSGRSIEPYNMFEELTKCRELLVKFGGHKMAAGLSLKEENIEALRKALNGNAVLTEDDFNVKISIDIVMPLGYVKEELTKELAILEPFGKGNEKPVFAERNLIVHRCDILGKNKNVLKLRVENEWKKEMDAMYFGDIERFFAYIKEKFGQKEMEKMLSGSENSVRLSVTYYPDINEYNGYKKPQILIQNYQ